MTWAMISLNNCMQLYVNNRPSSIHDTRPRCHVNSEYLVISTLGPGLQDPTFRSHLSNALPRSCAKEIRKKKKKKQTTLGWKTPQTSCRLIHAHYDSDTS